MDFLIHLDHIIFHFINQTLSNSWLDVLMPFVTDLHRTVWFKFVLFPIFLALYFFKYKKIGIFYFFFCLLSIGVTDLTGNVFFKQTVERPRPFNVVGLEVTKRSPARGQSFISNHAANMFAFATFTSIFIPGGRIIFFAFALLISFSRIYNGVHFPLDVICGALWGISISLLFAVFAKELVKKLSLKKESSSS